MTPGGPRGVLRAAGGFVGGLACALLLTSCGDHAGAPHFVQAFGAVESPCAVQAAPPVVLQHCVADVLLQNQGGQGYGHLTILVQLKDAKAGSAHVPAVRCGTSIPDTPAGGYADLACRFDLAPGQSIATYPIVQAIDFVGASGGGSSDPSSTAIATLVLTAATALLAVAALIVVLGGGRRPIVVQANAGGSSSRASGATSPAPRGPLPAQRASAKPGDPDAEYDLPTLPR